MKIYTKAGDTGETALYGGIRVLKTSERICAYGTLDELNAFLGLVASDERTHEGLRISLTRIQNELFHLGAELATPPEKKVAVVPISEADVVRMEKEIDAMEAELKPLKNFILPGGSRVAAELHLARTVCRRAEREAVTLHGSEPLRPIVIKYINRLSDLLFVMARFQNHKVGVADVPWKQ